MDGVSGGGRAVPGHGRSSGHGRGHGKLLLFGEHAAVYGYPAVGLSLPETLDAELEPLGPAEAGGPWVLENVPGPEGVQVLEVLRLAGELRPDLRPSGTHRVRLRTAIPAGVGFGSSAALCTALSAALHDLHGTASGPEDRDRVWELAHRCEALFHGTPSGVDTGLSLLDGLIRFLPRPPALPDARRLTGLPLHLVAGAVPRARGTGALVAELRRSGSEGSPEVVRRLALLGEIAGRAIALMEDAAPPAQARRLEELSGLCGRADAALRALGLCTPELDALLDAGRAAGALGGKLSGAGGGGAFFLLFPGPDETAAALEPLRRCAAALGLPSGAYLRPLRFQPR